MEIRAEKLRMLYCLLVLLIVTSGLLVYFVLIKASETTEDTGCSSEVGYVPDPAYLLEGVCFAGSTQVRSSVPAIRDDYMVSAYYEYEYQNEKWKILLTSLNGLVDDVQLDIELSQFDSEQKHQGLFIINNVNEWNSLDEDSKNEFLNSFNEIIVNKVYNNALPNVYTSVFFVCQASYDYDVLATVASRQGLSPEISINSQ